MSWFRNRTTTTKLMMTFGVMAGLVGFVGYQGVRGLTETEGHLKTIFRRASEVSDVREAETELMRMTRDVRTALLDASVKDWSSVDRRVEELKYLDEKFLMIWKRFEAGLRPEAKALVDEVQSTYAKLQLKQEQILVLARANKLAEAHAELPEVRAAVADVEARMNRLMEAQVGIAKRAVEDSEAVVRATTRFVLALVAVAAFLAVAIGFVIARMIGRPMAEAVGVLEAVAGGDFTRKLTVSTGDEVGKMAEALNAAIDGMRAALHEVAVAANQAAVASLQLSASSEQLSAGAQEHASSLQETAASLEQITSTVKQNADNARQANQLAVGSRDVAEKGGQVVAEAVKSMFEINKSSKKIADIIGTIDEIAFQTNLLALNAAVEAARAGEQGRGFAVVAAEVRNLAQRSATAAKEIKSLIQDSVQKVEAGSGLVNRSGETLNEIVSSVKRVTDIIAEIAAASAEQSTGIDHLNKAVIQMDELTQTNAAQTEEVSSTAQSFAAQAEQLQALVARFRLDDGPSSTPRPTPPVSATQAPKVLPMTRPPEPIAAKAGPRKPARRAAPAHVGNGNRAGHGTHDGFEDF